MGWIDKALNWIENTFPSESKDGSIVRAFLIVAAAFIAFISLAGFVIHWLTGIAWWWIWVGLIGYYFLIVIKHQIEINKIP